MHKKLWNKDFLLLLQGNAVSAVGDLLYSVAIGYWVYEKTGSSGLMGIMSSISMFVTMFLSPFAGSIVDKCSRRFIIVGMDVLRGIIMLVIGALAFSDRLGVPAVLAAAFLCALCSVFFSPAVSTLMIDIIPHGDMVRGQSVHSGVTSMINMIGKAFSGVLVAVLGVPLIVVINGICYLFSAFTELFIAVPKTVRQGDPITLKGIFGDFSTAIRAIFANRFLRLFVPTALILNLLGTGPLSLLLPFCMEKGFTVDMYGYLMSAMTAASLLCVLLLGVIKLKPRFRFWVMGTGFSLSLFFYVASYFSAGFTGVCALSFLGCMMNCAGNTIFNASLMLAMPEENRGTILGFISASCVGGSALSTLVYGLLGEVFPLYILFAAGSLLSLFPMVYMCFHRNTKEFILAH